MPGTIFIASPAALHSSKMRRRVAQLAEGMAMMTCDARRACAIRSTSWMLPSTGTP